MNRQLQQPLRQILSEALGSGYADADFRPCGAGCINETWEAYTKGVPSVFLKLGPADAADMYRQEQLGLNALRQCEGIRVPEVLAQLEWDNGAALVLEYIELHSPKSGDSERIGEGLAQLHSLTNTRFGFEHDNYIGRTPQINRWSQDWWSFWCDNRMRPQWRLAQIKGIRPALVEKIDSLTGRIPTNFGEHQPKASLLHGDLWSGNLAVDENGVPVLFDPAAYYGDSETDIAMSRMFGAMRPMVYDIYHAIHPIAPGAERRRQLYDLYHWLNHFNLFGVTYLGQVENAVDDLLTTMD